jgi:ADP-L-glycero-D-manno-heptose 6-epimerase
MIIVTGGAGFIGSAFVWKLNQEGQSNIIIVDTLKTSEKWRNLVPLKYVDYWDRDDFLTALLEGSFPYDVESIIHMGACSATTELDGSFLMSNNFRYTRLLSEYCLKEDCYFMYASSAATYGEGHQGFSDSHSVIDTLRPINRYGYSKQLFDQHALRKGSIKHQVGLKFFNVFGPNEFHKNDMKSIVCKAHTQILETGKIRLFKSHRDDYGDGEQKRDFVYVKDVVNLMWDLYKTPSVKGIFNVGRGEAHTWNDLATALFKAMNLETTIEYFDMPESLRNQYQYYTCADMSKIKMTPVPYSPASLNDSVSDYVNGFLKDHRFLGQ